MGRTEEVLLACEQIHIVDLGLLQRVLLVLAPNGNVVDGFITRVSFLAASLVHRAYQGRVGPAALITWEQKKEPGLSPGLVAGPLEDAA